MPVCRRHHSFLAIAAIGLALVGCTTSRTGSGESAGDVAEVEFNDPLEEVNRSIFRFNQVVDEVVLDDRGGRMFVCSDTDNCEDRQARDQGPDRREAAE